MASPQIEDGHTRIANEILDHLPRFKFNGSQLRIILVVLRQTYGFRRKEHTLSVRFLAIATNLSKRQVERELEALIKGGVIIVVKIEKKTRVLAFNKDYSQWENEDRPLKSGQSHNTDGLVDTNTDGLVDDITGLLVDKRKKKETLKETMSGYLKIITYLNQKTGSNYSHKSKANQKLINGRMSEGRSIEDFMKVIDVKTDQWRDDEKMNTYLRPSTLFSAKNFENYLNQKPRIQKSKDLAIESRDKEIEFARWQEEGKDPNDFDWS